MIRYTVELYRIQIDLSVLIYMLFSELNILYPLEQKKYSVIVKRKGIFPMFAMLVFAITSFILLIVIGNKDAVLIPILTNNRLFNTIF